MEQAEVEYRDIPGFPGYRAGDDGSVESQRGPRDANGNPTWRRLAPAWNKRSGSLQILLGGSRPRKCVSVARLVLLAFVGPCPEGKEACHGPSGALDNRLCNLRYGTHLENMRDKERDGTVARGERSGTAKLDDGKVREIRLLLAGGLSRRETAARFRVSTHPIHCIARGESWNHVA